MSVGPPEAPLPEFRLAAKHRPLDELVWAKGLEL
jgi:hypothetical protein